MNFKMKVRKHCSLNRLCSPGGKKFTVVVAYKQPQPIPRMLQLAVIYPAGKVVVKPFCPVPGAMHGQFNQLYPKEELRYAMPWLQDPAGLRTPCPPPIRPRPLN